MLAEGLRADGWFLRSEITWCKKSPMPESVTDRPTCATEKIFLLSKSASYYYDAFAVRQPYSEATLPESLPGWEQSGAQSPSDTKRRIIAGLERNGGANLRNFWLLGPEPYLDAHFATFVSEIPRRAIMAGTSARGVCPECGEPWFRVVEKSGGTIGKGSWVDHDLDDEQGKSQPSGSRAGWASGCTCAPLDPIPATVLDCFGGVMTTACVAMQLISNLAN